MPLPVVGLGVDIEEVERFRSLVGNKRFLAKVFSNQEIVYCRRKKNKVQHFAVRFAAKEAVWKALSDVLDNLGKKMTHKEISIKNTKNGKPLVVLPPSLSRYEKNIVVSLSHTQRYAVAVAHVALPLK